jgi:putative membrane protein insertion efficiency factor
MSGARGGLVRSTLLAAIGFYSRAISPALPPRCRFYPSCSAYAAEAISRHGAARGSRLAIRRLLKCAPWHPGGVDLVPGAVPRARADDRSGTPATSHSSSTAEAPPAPPADGARRPDTAPQPPATPPLWRRAPYEESSVA